MAGYFDVNNEEELLRLLQQISVSPEQAAAILGGGGFDVSPDRRPLSQEEAAAFAATNRQYGWQEIPEIDQWIAPYSPEEKARRAVLDAVTNLAYRSAEEPKAAYPAAQLGGWLTSHERMRGEQRLGEMSIMGELASSAMKTGGGSPLEQKRQLIAEALKRVASTGGKPDPEDLAILVALGVPSWAVTRIAPNASKSGVPDPKRALLKLVNQTDITGEPSPVAVEAARVLASLARNPDATDDDYWEALRKILTGGAGTAVSATRR